MKKILFVLMVGLIFAGCEPNEELYDKLDEQQGPYNEQIAYTLQSADYSRISDLVEDSVVSEYIEDNYKFHADHPIKEIFPLFLDDKFPALDKKSKVNLTYDYSPGYLEKFNDVVVDTLSAANYDTLATYDTLEFGDDVEFLMGEQPDKYLPQLLSNELRPFAREHTLAQVYYEYKNDYNITSLASGFYYLKDDTWQPLPGVYQLSDEDYQSIEGVSNDYFLTQDAASAYIPVFLKEHFPYANTGDSKVVVYEVTGTYNITASQFLLDSSGWHAKVPKSTQFAHNGEVWKFDPTVYYRLKVEDYLTILNYVLDNPDIPDLLYDPERPPAANTEYYYGASPYFGNFDTRVFLREDYEPETFEGMGEDEIEQIMFERIVKEAIIIALEARFPDAVPKVDGLDVYYEITFDAYDGNDDVYTVKYQCTAAGDPPTFEYVEGNTPYTE